MKLKLTLVDSVTEETREVEIENKHSELFQWTENNYACDCNRCPYFGIEIPEGETEGYCFGEKRFLVISVQPEAEGYSLQDFNRGYPKELLIKYGIIKENS